jgi:hypothetical protein
VSVDLAEGDVYAQLTDLRNGLGADGYRLEIIGVSSRVELAIRADEDACADCLVGKSLMTTYVVTALRDLSDSITADDVQIAYPNER